MSTNKQAREELRKRYTPPEIPNCSICGASLSIQRCGGGEPTVYACDGYEADPENPGMVRRAAGRDIADKHYEESRYIDWKKGGDSDVVALLDELEAAEKRIAELEAALKNSVTGYKSCLRMGHDRIIDIGGECDSPELMISGNPDIQQAEKILAAGIGVKGE